jgi:hypothetical protein
MSCVPRNRFPSFWDAPHMLPRLYFKAATMKYPTVQVKRTRMSARPTKTAIIEAITDPTT